jgi:6-pyruvoyltetrahydropterin/6-carboxytetrahydropterin synthase
LEEIKLKITKEITFDSAHMLSDYSGKCNNLHGHTYKLQLTIDGGVDQKTNMVLDFNIVKSIVNEVVMSNFDHAIIFSASEFREESENELLEWAKKYSKRHIVLYKGKSTCENMTPIIRDAIYGYLKNHGYKDFEVSVKLWETPTSFAEC